MIYIRLQSGNSGLLDEIIDTNVITDYVAEAGDIPATQADFEHFQNLADPRKWDSMTYTAEDGWVPRAGFDSRDYYVEDRAAAYPTIEDQLDSIFHKGVAGWMEEVTLIKEEFPKPPPLDPAYLP